MEIAGAATGSLRGLGHFVRHDRLHLDGAPAHRWNAFGQGEGLVQTGGLDLVVDAELLLGCGKGSVRDGAFSVAYADGGCGGGFGQFVATAVMPGLMNAAGVLPVLLIDGVSLFVAE